MGLPHFTNLSNVGSPGGPGTKPDEPVYLNLFEIAFIFPVILQAQGRNPILLTENATKINFSKGFTDEIGIKTQRFKYSTRAFTAAGPEQTHVEFDIDFQISVNNSNHMELWNTLKAWYDLVWNSQTGYLHYKSDTIGTIIVNVHDKKGFVIRRLTLQNAQIYKIGGMDLNWEESNIWTTSASFVADYWIDEYNDINFAVNPPTIPGYQ